MITSQSCTSAQVKPSCPWGQYVKAIFSQVSSKSQSKIIWITPMIILIKFLSSCTICLEHFSSKSIEMLQNLLLKLGETSLRKVHGLQNCKSIPSQGTARLEKKAWLFFKFYLIVLCCYVIVLAKYWICFGISIADGSWFQIF